MAAYVQRHKVWLMPTIRVPCSNAAKTRNPLKLPGVPQTNERISAASGRSSPYCGGHVEDILLLNKFFFRLSIRALVAKIWPDEVVRWCQDDDFWRLFMAALCNRGAIIFLACDFYLSIFLSFCLLFFPRLISAVGDWMFTILPHMVWP